jgi:Ca2+-binding EF-hand superfamily protein
MKRQITSGMFRFGLHLFIGCLLTSSSLLQAQQPVTGRVSGPPIAGGRTVFHAGGKGGGFGLVINGIDIGMVLLKTFDLDKNSKVAPAELKDVAAACFTLWDANADGSVTTSELTTALKELFPAPPTGGVRGVRVVNGVAVEVSTDQLPTPDGQVAKHLLERADSNKNDALTLEEVSAFLLGKCFSDWDQDRNGSLDAQELNGAFAQLAKPDQDGPLFQIAVPPPAR